MRPFSLLAAVPLLAGWLLMPGPVKAAEAATVREILDGNQLFIDARQAKLNQTALTPQEITTQNSRGQLEFGSGAAVRVNRFTQLRLGTGCFLLAKGQVLVSGKQSGCTKSLRLSSRSTNYLISLNDDGTTDVIVLEGTVEAEVLKGTEQSGNESPLLRELRVEINKYRGLAGNATFPPVPDSVQDAINPYGLTLINAMRKTGGCFHGGSNGVPSPFEAVKLPAGWTVLGEVLGCPVEPGVWDPSTVARMLWESPTHHRIVFDSKKALAIGCIWSMAKNKNDTEAMVCLTLRDDNTMSTPFAPLRIQAGFRFRFSADGKVLSSFKLSSDHYNAILKGPLFQGFGSNLPELEALKRFLRNQYKLEFPAVPQPVTAGGL